jgi:penicillin-binding protein-related factor A (putative recombinase)
VKCGIAYSIEAKMCKGNDTNFPFSRLESHQVENLLAFDAAGGCSYVVISFRKPKLTAYAVEINDWRDIARELLTIHNRKSIPRAWFGTDPRIIELPRIKCDSRRIWDFSVVSPPTT